MSHADTIVREPPIDPFLEEPPMTDTHTETDSLGEIEAPASSCRGAWVGHARCSRPIWPTR